MRQQSADESWAGLTSAVRGFGGGVLLAALPNLQTAMPGYRDVTDKEILDLARYIHYLRQQARYNDLISPSAESGDARRGGAFFSGAGGCATCHSGANALDGVAVRYDASTLRRQLLRPGPQVPAEGAQPTVGQAAHLKQLDDYSLEDAENLLAYVPSLD